MRPVPPIRTLTIDFTTAPPQGQIAAVATFDDVLGEWTPIPSTVTANTVSADIDHFSLYAVVFTDDEIVIVSECNDVVDAFTPCGGDPVGVWQVTDFCFANVVVGPNPFQEVCPEAILEGAFDLEATVTITATTQQVSASTITQSNHLELPLSCLDTVAGPGETCEEQTGTDGIFELDPGETGACVVNGALCICDKSISFPQPAGEEEPYTIVGTDMVDGEGERTPFCRSGTEVQLAELDDAQAIESIIVLSGP